MNVIHSSGFIIQKTDKLFSIKSEFSLKNLSINQSSLSIFIGFMGN